nr:2-methylfumaryl-CoA isomerase-like [Nerophis lumbriciformis]
MNNLLAGLRVIEGSAFVAAPLGGMTLAQMGADVIRFDPIGGGLDARRWPLAENGRSLYWAGMNKAKRSIMLDIRRPEGRELGQALITAAGENAGLFLTNFPATGWLDYDSLAQRRGDLIMVNITGNRDGSTAVDYTVNCAVGYPFITGSGNPDSPVNNVLPAWDIATGMSAAMGLLAAERHRRLHGEGQYVRLALSDVALAMTGHLGYLSETQLNGVERDASGNDVFGAFGRDFPTSDGRRLMVVAISKRQWQGLCEATGLGERFAHIEPMLGVDLNDEGDRYKARDAIAAVLEPWCKSHTLAEIRTVFDAHGVCWGPYQNFSQILAEDPRCGEPLFEQVEQPGIGTYAMAGLPHEFSASPRLPVKPAPSLGQHTDEVLAEVLGMASAEIGRLHDAGLIAGPD